MKKIVQSMCLTTAASLALMMSAADASAGVDIQRMNIDQYGNLQMVLANGGTQGNAAMVDPSLQAQVRAQAQAESLWVCGTERGKLLAAAENRITLPTTLSRTMQFGASLDEQSLSLDLPQSAFLGQATQFTCPSGYRPELVGVLYDQIQARTEDGAAVQGAPVAWMNNAFSDQVTARTTERGTFELSFMDKGGTGMNVVELGRQSGARILDDDGVQGSLGGQDVPLVPLVDDVERGSQGELPALGQDTADAPCEHEARGSK